MSYRVVWLTGKEYDTRMQNEQAISSLSSPVITAKASLSRKYGHNAVHVLQSFDIIDRGFGWRKDLSRKEQRGKVSVVRELPTVEEFQVMSDSVFKTSAENVIDNAEVEVTLLRDELQEWVDNLPEGLDQTCKAEELEEAINELDEAIDEIGLVVLQDRDADVICPIIKTRGKYPSRASRRDQIVADLGKLYDVLQADIDDLEVMKDDEPDGYEYDAIVLRIEDTVNTSENIEAIKDRLDEILFPGMF
tara:strand:- start:2402 stop:3145 length:744 start_codon:yes stop_codon:yes gene_type:complete